MFPDFSESSCLSILVYAQRLTLDHSCQTLERKRELADRGCIKRGIKFPVFHELMICLTLPESLSPFSFLVWVKVACSSTPTNSKWSLIVMYWHWIGRSSWSSTFLQPPKSKKLFPVSAGVSVELYITSLLQEGASSTTRNLFMLWRLYQCPREVIH